MKIVILSDDFPPRSFGGAGIIASTQAVELTKRGHDVSVITTVQDRTLEKTTTRDGVIIHEIYSNYSQRWRDYVSIYNPQTVSKVKKILKDIQPDIVHVHNVHIHLSYHVFSLAKSYSKGVFMTAHDSMAVHLGKIRPKMTLNVNDQRIFDYRISNLEIFNQYKLRWNPLRSFFIKHYLNKVNTIFSVSSALSDTLKQNGIINGIEVMHNGIDAKSFSADKKTIDEFKSKYNLNNKKVMFFGGRISRTKGGDLALNILREIHKTIPEVLLLIVGQEDAYVQGLKATVKKENLEDSVVFTGWLDRKEIIPAYYSSDIVLVLSLYMDPFPTVNLEAMAAGKPVIATCYGGTPEAIKDGENGYVVDPDNLINVKEKVLSLLGDKSLLKTFGESGYARVLTDFNLSDMVDELERKYASIISHE